MHGDWQGPSNVCRQLRMRCHLSFRMAVNCEKPPPGDCYQDVEKLWAANFIEAYLEKDADEPGVWTARDTLLSEEVVGGDLGTI